MLEKACSLIILIMKEIEEIGKQLFQVGPPVLEAMSPGIEILAATPGSSGIDLVFDSIISIYDENSDLVTGKELEDILLTFMKKGTLILYPNYKALLGSAVKLMKCPNSIEFQVRPRSSVSLKTSIDVKLGTIDSDYLNKEIGIVVHNQGSHLAATLHKRDKIAQLVAVSILPPMFVIGAGVQVNKRTGGFGSTDEKI